ncbi:MAG: P-loop NTPase [Proteobacteria bacterium]|nr:P-loop NTPase [Pseudomonadota bacterium]
MFARKAGVAGSMHEEFMAFLMDEESFRTARAVAEAHGYPQAVVQQGGLDVLASMLEEAAPPKILLLDLDREKDPLDAGRRALSLCGPGCCILFAGSQNDVKLYRRLKQLGGADYLVKPLAEDLLRDALVQATKPASSETEIRNNEARAGKIMAVIGTRGGVGATTVAVSLAWICAHTLHQHVGMLDLDVHFGTTALAVDKEPGRGMRAALESPERLDGLLIASSMVQESEHLSILCAEEAFDPPLTFDGDAAMSLIKPVSGDFDSIFIDLPRMMLSAQKRLLANAHALVLVTDLTLAGLRDARRIRAYLKNIRPDLLPVMVASRTGNSASATVEKPAFEKNLETKFDFELPEDIKTAKLSANMGKTFAAVAPQAEVSKHLTALARLLTGIREEKKAAGGHGGFLKNVFSSGLPASKPAPKPA